MNNPKNNTLTIFKNYNYKTIDTQNPKSTKQLLDTAKFNLKCLENCYKGIVWNEFARREMFAFIYYNVTKLIYGANKAREMMLTKIQGMQKTLSEKEIYNIFSHTDNQIELMTLHSNGIYTYSPATIINALNLTEKQAENFGFYEAKKRKESYQVHQKKASKRDRIITELYLSGLGYKAIHQQLPDDLQCSLSTVRYTINRLKIKGRNLQIEQVNFDKNKRYSRKLTLTELPVSPNNSKDENIFIDKKCEQLYKHHLRETGSFSLTEQNDVLHILTLGKNVYLHGDGGTGKSTVLKKYYNSLSDDEKMYTVIVTPFGCASDNLGLSAKTIHSAFKLDTKVYSPNEPKIIPSNLLSMKRLIIDEISLLRIDIFNYIMRCVRHIEVKNNHPIQVIVVGDFGQMQPVVTPEEKPILKSYYGDAIYAFQSSEWKNFCFSDQVLRINRRLENSSSQSKMFTKACDGIKFGSLTALKWINENLSLSEDINATYICATNRDVDKFTAPYIKRFDNRKIYKATGAHLKKGPKHILELAVGMRVITLKNTNKYKNGSLGTITKLMDDGINVRFDNSNKVYKVKIEKFTEGDSIMCQLPIAIAAALTVNKAQGLTLDAINIVPGFFSPGALYAALTRCKSVENIHIVGKLTHRDLRVCHEAISMCI